MAHQKILLALAGLLLAAAGGVFVFLIQGNSPGNGEIAPEALVAGAGIQGEEVVSGGGEAQAQETELFEAGLQTGQQTALEAQPGFSSPVKQPDSLASTQPAQPDADENNEAKVAPEPAPVPPVPKPQPAPKPVDKININTGSLQELDQITGVGPATAQKIIDYRNTVSLFYHIEDIKNVSGIGEATFEKMKDEITVGDVGPAPQPLPPPPSPAPAPTPAPVPAPSPQPSSEKININTAGYEELQEIIGVGQVIAQRIIDYRTQNGPFQAIEEIKNVSGIGDVTFEKMEDAITI